MLTSAACAAATLRTSDPPQAWHTAQAMLNLSPLADTPHWRPVKLALYTPRGEVVIDVTDVSLVDADGREVLANGDFSRGFDSWWMSAEVKAPYQIDSLPVAVLLEQGWFGVLAWATLLAVALFAGARAAWAGNPVVTVALPALAAFGVAGSLNTLIDEPRFLLLLLLLVWGCISTHAAASGGGRRTKRVGLEIRHGAQIG